MVESNGKKIVPPCCQCEGAGVTCYGKTHRPGCWRCLQQKIGCSMVEVKKRKGKEMEVIKVKRSRKGNRVKMGEADRRTEAMEAMVTEMRRIADGVEALVAGQQEIIVGIDRVVEEQRSLGFGVEVLWRKIEEGMGEKSKGKEKGEDIREMMVDVGDSFQVRLGGRSCTATSSFIWILDEGREALSSLRTHRFLESSSG